MIDHTSDPGSYADAIRHSPCLHVTEYRAPIARCDGEVALSSPAFPSLCNNLLHDNGDRP